MSRRERDDEEEWIIWDSDTGVLNLTSSSEGIPTDFIIPSPDKYGVFLSFSFMTTFLVSSVPYPSSDKLPRTRQLPPFPVTHFFGRFPFFPSLWRIYLVYTPSSSPSEGSRVVFTKLPSFWCALFHFLRHRVLWDQNRTELYSLFLLFFDGGVIIAARLSQLTHWVGLIYSVWIKDNGLAHPKMGKIMIYHVQSRSKRFKTKLQTKFHNTIGFDPGTSFGCACVALFQSQI